MVEIKNFLKQGSLRRSIIFYITVFALIAMALTGVTASVCNELRNHIHAAYPETSEKYYLTNMEGERLGEGAYISKQEAPYSEVDRKLLDFLDAFPLIMAPVYSAVCIIAAALLFYRNRLKKPISELRGAAEKISNNELNFTVQCGKDDELGQLCRAFEVMRSALEANFLEMWRQMDERKRLNGAFAHDLRTPLTIIKGYSEMLEANKDSQVANTALTISTQVSRLEHYADSMSRLQRLEECVPAGEPVNMKEWIGNLEKTGILVSDQWGKEIVFENKIQDEYVCIDVEFVEQVYENLISNALRYAKSKIRIYIFKEEDLFCLSVEDDGPGFTSESLKRASEPYFTESGDRGKNYGLGLYICRIFCEHHGGYLKIENGDEGGCVTAVFKEFPPGR